jgi:hypothetical protein
MKTVLWTLIGLVAGFSLAISAVVLVGSVVTH